MVEDTLGLTNGSVLLADFALGVVYQESAGIIDQPFDGFIGFGFRGSSPNSKAPTNPFYVYNFSPAFLYVLTKMCSQR